MNRIQGKTVIITGATAGIGKSCARLFAERGANLILLARRKERLNNLCEELSGMGIEVTTRVHDVRDRSLADELAKDLQERGIVPDILINNAGLGRGLGTIQDGNIEDWEEMIDTNIKGLLYITRAILPMMVEQDHGHIINIGSIAGRWVYPSGNVYNATKFAVYALNEAMSVDLLGTNVRVSSVDPGAVETEFSLVRFRGDEERAKKTYTGYTPLTPDDVADSVCYVANTPPHVNILQLVIMPTDQRSVTINKKKCEDRDS
jgi:3-hydroxy acid dehydrogenase/malonic semialdehyde reductase